MSKAARPITLVRAICTSTACPSQWDAWDAEGRYYYLRYRHGYGSVESAESEEVWDKRFENLQWDEQEKVWRGEDPVTLEATFEHGHPLDGHISLEDFAQLAGITLAANLDTTGFWRHIHNQLSEEFKDDPGALARADQLLGGIDLDTGEAISTN
jgi:hypothetical protein